MRDVGSVGKVPSRSRRGVVGVLLLIAVFIVAATYVPAGDYGAIPNSLDDENRGVSMATGAAAWARGTGSVSGDGEGNVVKGTRDTSASASQDVNGGGFGVDVLDRGEKSFANDDESTGLSKTNAFSKLKVPTSSSQRCVADPAHAPKMTANEKSTILKYITGAFAGSTWTEGEARYLEWGGGGSTSAFGTKAKLVHTVEHAPQWCEIIKQWDEMRCLTEQSKWQLFCHDSHMPLKKWGYPEDGTGDKWHSTKPKSQKEKKTDRNFAENMRRYVQAPGRDQFTENTHYYDVVLIDGRLRSACAYSVLPYLRENSVILWHDFGKNAWKNIPDETEKIDVNRKIRDPTWHGDRLYSKAASRIFDGVEHVDTLAVFRVKPSVFQQIRVSNLSFTHRFASLPSGRHHTPRRYAFDRRGGTLYAGVPLISCADRRKTRDVIGGLRDSVIPTNAPMFRPVELALGEPHVPLEPSLPSSDGFLFSDTWHDIGEAFSKDPTLALGPLKALRDRRFIVPNGNGKGWPPSAVPTLFNGLEAARACAGASPTLAGELWVNVALLLAAWAKWHCVISHGQSDSGTVSAIELHSMLRNIIDAIARDAAAWNNPGCNSGNNTLFVPGEAQSAVPSLVLACVASSQHASREIKVLAFDASLKILETNNERARNASNRLPVFQSAQDARALVSAFVYLVQAIEQMSDNKTVIHTQTRRLAECVFPLWCGDGLAGSVNGHSNVDGASASFSSAAAQRAGILLSRAMHVTSREFPKVTEMMASISNEILTGNDEGMAFMRPGATYVASGVLLAVRRPPSDPSAFDLGLGTATHVDVESIRSADIHASSAMEAAALRASLLAADDQLATEVAKAFVTSNNVSNATRYPHGDTNIAHVRMHWSMMCAGSLCASRCVAERVTYECAADEVGELPMGNQSRGNTLREACESAVVGGAYRSASLPLQVLSLAFERNVDPISAGVVVGSVAQCPLSKRASELIELVCAEAARRETRYSLATVALREATKNFAKKVQEGYRGFCKRAPKVWRDALDPGMTRPPFVVARAAITTAAEFLTVVGFPKGPPGSGTVRSVDTADTSFRLDALRCAADSLANIEFARGADFDTVTTSAQIFGVSLPVLNSGKSTGRYAMALTRMAAALSDNNNDNVGPGFRKSLALELIPTERFEDVGNTGTNITHQYDPVSDTRAHLLLRLFPYAAPGLGNVSDNLNYFKPVITTAFRYLGHPSTPISRTAHITYAASFRAAPDETVSVYFLPYLRAFLDGFPKDDRLVAAFIASVGVVAERGGNSERGRAAIATAIDLIVTKIAELENDAVFSGGLDDRNSKTTQSTTQTLRKVVFGLLPLVDHRLVLDTMRGSEKAVLSSKTKESRVAAYADLVESVLAITNVARKQHATHWALGMRARI